MIAYELARPSASARARASSREGTRPAPHGRARGAVTAIRFIRALSDANLGTTLGGYSDTVDEIRDSTDVRNGRIYHTDRVSHARARPRLLRLRPDHAVGGNVASRHRSG